MTAVHGNREAALPPAGRALRHAPHAARAPPAPPPPPLADVARHRVSVYADPSAEGSPHRLGIFPRAAVAGLIVGHRPLRYALFFLLADGWQMDELDFALNTIRAALGARLVDAHVRGSFREARQ